ncbi:hypothetical protein ACVGOW_06080 [Pseudonocardia saturnea]
MAALRAALAHRRAAGRSARIGSGGRPAGAGGTGILPARVAARAFPNTSAYWLVADAAALGARVRAVSGFADRTAGEKLLIERFLGRTTRFDDLLREDVGRSGLGALDVGAGQSVDELVERILGDRDVR